MLGNFNRTVLLVASILLILGLIIIGFFSVKNLDSERTDVWDSFEFFLSLSIITDQLKILAVLRI